jgi:hypothetical protein
MAGGFFFLLSLFYMLGALLGEKLKSDARQIQE